jgi:hypothetical protein
MESEDIDLTGGDYAFFWTGVAASDVGCFQSLTLTQADGAYTGTIMTALLQERSNSGSSNLHNVPPGRYYVDAISGCNWSVLLNFAL